MPIKPEKITLSDVQANAAAAYSAENPDVSATNLQKAAAQILNTIRDNASANYQNYVPELIHPYARLVRSSWTYSHLETSS